MVRLRFNLTLPAPIAAAVECMVTFGAHAPVDDCRATAPLQDRDTAPANRLGEPIAAGHQDYLADPTEAVPADDILPRVTARRAAQSRQQHPGQRFHTTRGSPALYAG